MIRSSLKQSYIEKFLKLDDEVVMLLDLNYLFSSTDFDQVQDLTEGESDVIESE